MTTAHETAQLIQSSLNTGALSTIDRKTFVLTIDNEPVVEMNMEDLLGHLAECGVIDDTVDSEKVSELIGS